MADPGLKAFSVSPLERLPVSGKSVNHLIRAQEERWRDGQLEGLRGLWVDYEIKLDRLIDLPCLLRLDCERHGEENNHERNAETECPDSHGALLCHGSRNGRNRPRSPKVRAQL
jgi:hypothetical protein